MHTIEDLVVFVREISAVEEVRPESDVFEELGVSGDDFHEMMDKYAKKCAVDMTNYLWYFHADEEGWSTGRIFFKPPYKQVTRIIVTPTLLADFANKGEWKLIYPEHKIAVQRFDILINQVMFIAFLLWAAVIMIFKLF